MTDADGYSRLDDAGIRHIEETRRAQLDLSDHTITRADVAPTDNDIGPIVGSPRGPRISLRLKAPHGSEEVETSTFSVAFNAAGQDASSSSDTTPSTTIGPAITPSGLILDLTLRPTSDGGRTFQYDVLLDHRYYAPESLAHIRTTGKAPMFW